MKILWYISPIDGPRPWAREGRYEVDHRRLRRLAMTLDQGGFYGALIGTYTHDTWTTSVSLIGSTERMRFMIPHYAGATPPVVMAQRALTFDDYSRGRLILHLVNGQDQTTADQGVVLGHDERYDMAEEYWGLFRRLYAGEQFDHRGRYFTVGGYRTHPDVSTALPLGPIQLPHTPFWGGGDSARGIETAGRLLDNHFTMLRHPDSMAPVISAVREAALRNGRTLRHGALGSVIVRETEEEALAAFHSMFEETGAGHIVRHQAALLKHMRGIDGGIDALHSDNPAVQARIDALRSGRVPTLEELRIAPNMYAGMTSWSSVDLFGIGIATYLVGSADQVAARLRELQDGLGIDTFILSGWPLIREAEYVADLLLPLLELDDEPPVLADHYAEPQLSAV